MWWGQIQTGKKFGPNIEGDEIIIFSGIRDRE